MFRRSLALQIFRRNLAAKSGCRLPDRLPPPCSSYHLQPFVFLALSPTNALDLAPIEKRLAVLDCSTFVTSVRLGDDLCKFLGVTEEMLVAAQAQLSGQVEDIMDSCSLQVCSMMQACRDEHMAKLFHDRVCSDPSLLRRVDRLKQCSSALENIVNQKLASSMNLQSLLDRVSRSSDVGAPGGAAECPHPLLLFLSNGDVANCCAVSRHHFQPS
jgi:hypothetical protein